MDVQRDLRKSTSIEGGKQSLLCKGSCIYTVSPILNQLYKFVCEIDASTKAICFTFRISFTAETSQIFGP